MVRKLDARADALRDLAAEVVVADMPAVYQHAFSSINTRRHCQTAIGKDNRSVEYDSLGDRYARFLIEELIPEVQKVYRIVDDPADSSVCGKSWR